MMYVAKIEGSEKKSIIPKGLAKKYTSRLLAVLIADFRGQLLGEVTHPCPGVSCAHLCPAF